MSFTGPISATGPSADGVQSWKCNAGKPIIATVNVAPTGLTTAEAQDRLQQFGRNRVEEEKRHPLLSFLAKFWAPVPWMLEATIVLEIVVHKLEEAAIIGVLLLFNSLLSFVQENQANRALALLRQRLSIQARVLRDGHWQLIPAEELVPGDVIHLRLGDLVPADVRLFDGVVETDESELTGESQAVEKSPGATVYAGSQLKRGEASGEVIATGQRTYFGKTAELVKTAKTSSHLQEIIFAIVKYLVIFDAVLVGALLVYAGFAHLPWSEVLPFALILLVASVPVALPATFTVATALGALDMSHQGVLVTRLSAIEEAAAMDVLCTDKTGTITQNRLAVSQIVPAGGRSPEELLRMAALASDAATQDPIDLAILGAAKEEGVLDAIPHRLQFIPFDPATKRSEAIYDQPGGNLRVVKGAPDALTSLVSDEGNIADEVERLAGRGARVLSVAAGMEHSLEFAGLLGLEDPIRDDSKTLVQSLKSLGVRVIMVTGDGPATALAVSLRVDIGDRVGSAEDLRNGAGLATEKYDVFAGVFPEDKFRLVQALQQQGHVVGMTGDGVNDAPALKQAEAGIAVSTATDVAKAAASVVLTESGLTGVLRAVETGRRIYQRMLTYTLNKIIKTLEICGFPQRWLDSHPNLCHHPSPRRSAPVHKRFRDHVHRDRPRVVFAAARSLGHPHPDVHSRRARRVCFDSVIHSLLYRQRRPSLTASAAPDACVPHVGFYWPGQRLSRARTQSPLAFGA